MSSQNIRFEGSYNFFRPFLATQIESSKVVEIHIIFQ
jgi:hypothetical protein